MSIRRWINLVSVVIIVIFLNLIAVRYYYKIDLTENKIYTVSEATKKTLFRLKNPLNVKVIVSDDIPSPYNTSVRFFLDVLNEYKSVASDKVKIDIIQDVPQIVEKAANLYGIPPVQVNAIESDSLQIKKIYMGAVLIYEDKTETIPVIANVRVPEYELTSLIKRMSSENEKYVAIIDAGKSANPYSNMRTVFKALSKNYKVESVKIEKGKLIDKKYDVAILVSPIEELKPEEVYPIEEFLFSGKSVILAVDKVDGSVQSGYAFKKETGFEKFFNKNGIKLTNNLVFDANATLINVSRNAGGFIVTTAVKYPFFPEIINFNRELLVTKGVSTVNMIFPTEIKIDKKNQMKVTPIMFSSDKTGLEKEPYNVALDRQYSLNDFQYSKIPLAFILEGKFVSEFEKPLNEYKDNFRNKGVGKLILVSDGEMFKDDYVVSGDNLKLIQNVVDFLLSDPELLELRGKVVKFHPIMINSPSNALLIKYLILFAPPIFIIVIGFVVMKIFGKRRVRL
ncbi:GldG family protein [Deferribacter abyssi]|uniref:GldG family protein n=1 Tax=Deferribacter abyssi TaxID=213806 RepID=UPI003C294029